MFQRITTHAKQVIKRATLIAHAQHATEVTPDHILAGLFSYPHGLASKILQKLAIAQASSFQLHEISSSQTAPSSITLAHETVKLIEKAALMAYEFRHSYIGTEHLLAGILVSNQPTFLHILKQQHIDREAVEKHISIVLKSTSKFSEITKTFLPEQEETTQTRQDTKKNNGALAYFAVHLTAQETIDTMDPIIGREQEIERVITVLSRRTKSNPLLLGDPGVGKTAIVEGLAQRIASGDVPQALQGKNMYMLDMGGIVAGTMYRGEFESRIKQIIEEAKQQKNVILFIDEIHTIIGAGSASGSLDAANILKPALARGDISCIGATTLEEYKKVFEGDAALERRFQPIPIEEPSQSETIRIISGIKKMYETFHHVSIDDNTIQHAVEYAARYIPDRFFPDKAIDLLDEAGAYKKSLHQTQQLYHSLAELKKERFMLEQQKIHCIKEEQFEDAEHIKDVLISLDQSIANLTEDIARVQAHAPAAITIDDIVAVVSRITHIPPHDILHSPTASLSDIETRFTDVIYGQNTALTQITQVLKRGFAGLSDPHKPKASFLFLGPSGIGKTLTAKTIAEKVYNDPKALIQIDMSEFSESFHVSKLLGAPAGYVGYKDETSFTDKVRRRPYCVVLFDEVEKAHPHILHLLLQVLDEGHITDNTGRKIYFHNATIILTSNIGSAYFGSEKNMGFSHAQSAHHDTLTRDLIQHARELFTPELVNRFDKVVVFSSLSKQDLASIAQREIARITERLSHQQIRCAVSQKVITALVSSLDPRNGARDIQHEIQEKIETPIADAILSSSQKPIHITVGWTKNGITLTCK